jgi:hypothetical protein
MSIIHLPNGIGETLGDSLATTSPLEVNGNVWYVHYGTGTDAVSPAGQSRQAPLKTFDQANTNAASGDVVVLMDGHEETIAATITVSKDLTVIGAGSSGGLPTVKLTNNQAAGQMLSITAQNYAQFRNIWFEEELQANSAAKLVLSSAFSTGDVIFTGCYFQCGQYDDDYAVEITQGSSVVFKNTTFISTATSIATQPYAAIGTVSGSTLHAVVLDGAVIDGGTYGWSKYHAVDLVDQQPTMVIGESVSLLRGSDVRIHSSAVGYFNASTQSGGCRIDWDGVT